MLRSALLTLGPYTFKWSMVELNSIRGVGEKTAQSLKSGGIEDGEDLAQSSIDDLKAVGISDTQAEKLIQRAGEKTISIQSTMDRQKEYDSRETISTGIPELDDMVGGGFEEEAIIAAYGRPSSGKTQCGLFAMVNAVEQTGDPAVYIETEKDRFRPERLKQFTDDEEVLSKIHAIRAYDLDDQYNAYGKIAEAFDTVSLVVVDSFTARFRLAEQFEGRENLGKRAQEFRRHLNRLEQLGKEMNCPIYLSCQVSANPDQYGKSEFIYGSMVFQHMANYLLHLRPDAGDLRAIELENHPARADDEIQINITETGVIGIR